MNLTNNFSSSRQEVDVARARSRTAIDRLNQCSKNPNVQRVANSNVILDTSEQQVLSA